MSAIITETFRRNNAKLFLGDITTGTNKYYVGLGKSEAWPTIGGVAETSSNYNVPLPTGTAADRIQTLNNLTSLLRVETTRSGLVIPNNLLKTGRSFKAYSPYDINSFYPTGTGTITYPCYLNNGSHIYICLRAGASYATTLPANTTYGIETTADGYTWAYVAPLIAGANAFNTEQFIQISSDKLTGTPKTNALNATGGRLFGYTVVNGGTGYVKANTRIYLRGTTSAGVDFSLNLNPSTPGVADSYTTFNTGTGTITSINLPASIANWPTQNLKNASIEITNLSGGVGTGAVALPNIAPPDGFGYSPSEDLPTWYVGLGVSASGDISGDGFYIPYRQITVLKNPTIVGNVTFADAGDSVTLLSHGFTAGEQIEFSTIVNTTGISTNTTYYVVNTSADTFQVATSPSGSALTLTNNGYGTLKYITSLPANARALQYFQLTSALTGVTDVTGLKITDASTTPAIPYGFADYYDSTTRRLYFHQNFESSFSLINASGQFKIVSSGGTPSSAINYSGISSGEYVTNTGELIFTENRKSIARASAQTEEIKIVIQF
jgi:hypothetical protein